MNYPVTASLVNGLWTVSLPAWPVARLLRQVRISGGPAGSTFSLYLGSLNAVPFDNTSRGDNNFEDYSNPVYVPKGYGVMGQWSSGSGSAPSCTFIFDRGL